MSRKLILPLIAATLLISNPLSVQAQSSNNCSVIGIKPSGLYYRSNQRSCIANVNKARSKGFESASTNSTIRGFSFEISGSEEVPAVVTSATGTCLAALLADKTTLQVLCTHTISSPVAAHVHTGAIGVEGGILCDLGTGTSPISASCTLTKEQIVNLLNSDLYVNVHSATNTDGELRGQID